MMTDTRVSDDTVEVSQLTEEEIQQELLEDFLEDYPADVREDIDENRSLVSITLRAAFVVDGTVVYDEFEYDLVMDHDEFIRGADVIDILFGCDDEDDSEAEEE